MHNTTCAWVCRCDCHWRSQSADDACHERAVAPGDLHLRNCDWYHWRRRHQYHHGKGKHPGTTPHITYCHICHESTPQCLKRSAMYSGRTVRSLPVTPAQPCLNMMAVQGLKNGGLTRLLYAILPLAQNAECNAEVILLHAERSQRQLQRGGRQSHPHPQLERPDSPAAAANSHQQDRTRRRHL